MSYGMGVKFKPVLPLFASPLLTNDSKLGEECLKWEFPHPNLGSGYPTHKWGPGGPFGLGLTFRQGLKSIHLFFWQLSFVVCASYAIFLIYFISKRPRVLWTWVVLAILDQTGGPSNEAFYFQQRSIKCHKHPVSPHLLTVLPRSDNQRLSASETRNPICLSRLIGKNKLILINLSSHFKSSCYYHISHIITPFCTFPSTSISFLRCENQNCTQYSRCGHTRDL